MRKFRKILSATIVLCLLSSFTIFANATVNRDPNAKVSMTYRAASAGTSFNASVPVLPPVTYMATLTANKQVTGTYLDLDSGGRYKTVSVSQAYQTAGSSLSPFVDISKGTNGNWLGMYVGTHVPQGYDFSLLGYSNGVLADTASGYWYYN